MSISSIRVRLSRSVSITTSENRFSGTQASITKRSRVPEGSALFLRPGRMSSFFSSRFPSLPPLMRPLIAPPRVKELTSVPCGPHGRTMVHAFGKTLSGPLSAALPGTGNPPLPPPTIPAGADSVNAMTYIAKPLRGNRPEMAWIFRPFWGQHLFFRCFFPTFALHDTVSQLRGSIPPETAPMAQPLLD